MPADEPAGDELSIRRARQGAERNGGKREILKRQRRWARAAGLAVDTRGYLDSVDANLREPLSPSTRAAFEQGSGSELRGRGSAPAKMRALHSSAVLAVNVFDHWTRTDASPLLDVLGVEGALESLRFEAQFPTGLPGNPPNLDVALELRSGRVVAIESKFTEWLTAKRASRAPFKQKYFDGGIELWARQHLPRCQRLAAALMDGSERFRFLDVPQLLKHALGLATQRPGKFALHYLYFDVESPAGQAHRSEIDRARDLIGDDLELGALSYQDLYGRFRGRAGVDPGYLDYLGRRYFSD